VLSLIPRLVVISMRKHQYRIGGWKERDSFHSNWQPQAQRDGACMRRVLSYQCGTSRPALTAGGRSHQDLLFLTAPKSQRSSNSYSGVPHPQSSRESPLRISGDQTSRGRETHDTNRAIKHRNPDGQRSTSGNFYSRRRPSLTKSPSPEPPIY